MLEKEKSSKDTAIFMKLRILPCFCLRSTDVLVEIKELLEIEENTGTVFIYKQMQ